MKITTLATGRRARARLWRAGVPVVALLVAVAGCSSAGTAGNSGSAAPDGSSSPAPAPSSAAGNSGSAAASSPVAPASSNTAASNTAASNTAASNAGTSSAAAPTSNGPLTPLNVDLSFPYAASQWNCLYDYGIDKGFYAKYGTAPKFGALKGSVALINAVATGSVDIGVSAAVANVMQASSKGAPVKLIAVQENDSPNAVISLEKNPIKTPADLKGKKIAYSPSSLSGLSFELLLKHNNVPSSDVTVVGVQPAAYASALVSGSIDGYVSYPSSSVPNTEKAGGKPVVMLLRDFGVNPVPADGYIASGTTIKDRAQAVAGFLKGARDTWQYLFKHQDEALAAGQYCAKTHVGVNPQTSAQQIKLVLSGNSKFLSSPDFMGIDAAGLDAQIAMLKDAGQLPDPKPAKEYYTTDLLPKG